MATEEIKKSMENKNKKISEFPKIVNDICETCNVKIKFIILKIIL